MESKIGLLIQFTGVLLMTVLSVFLRRSLKTTASGLWAAAWASLSLALASLSFGFLHADIARPLFAIYFFGEYVFGLLLVFGCRAISDNDHDRVPPKRLILFLPFATLALALPYSADDFNLIFNLHTLLLGTFFAVAFHSLGNASNRKFGWRTMRVALFLLALDFFHYFVIFSMLKFDVYVPVPSEYLAYNPIMDLVLELMLGFGMVISLLEGVLEEVTAVNAKLKEAHEKLETLALVDPLTTALNRHAFYGYVHRAGEDAKNISGCVGFFDIDDLKPINDTLGHQVGDMAIRAVVGAIREIIRAEDLIYRWGGDEFFVLLVSMDSKMALERMECLERMLTNVQVHGVEQPLTINVSYGFHDFTQASELDAAIKLADEAMYREKQARKAARKAMALPPNHFISTEITQ